MFAKCPISQLNYKSEWPQSCHPLLLGPHRDEVSTLECDPKSTWAHTNYTWRAMSNGHTYANVGLSLN
uniref:Uncharacterized protein n=1 Tax=Vitis vinifera TaxID=29760 RepID=F6HPE5_VITVI